MYVPEPEHSTFTPPPSGTHAAICYRFIDLGTQVTEWQGAKKNVHKVLISWELPDARMEDGKPFTISQRYTWSMGDKANLRKVLEAWRGRAFAEADFVGPNRFDVKNIIGKPCLVTIVHVSKDGKTFANIASVSAMPKGMQPPQPENEPLYFAMDRERFSMEAFEKLSDKLKEQIRGAPEFAAMMNGGEPMRHSNGHDEALDDEIPF